MKIKELGTGFSGTTYLIKNKKKEYALKIQHIHKADIENKKSDLWREIYFAKYVSKYPTIFKHLYYYNIIDNCTFVKDDKKIGLKIYGNINEYNELQKSKYCVEFIYNYQINSLDTILFKLDIKQFYSLLLQLLYGIYILQKKKYTHNDLNLYNITYNITHKKYRDIIVNNKKYRLPLYKYSYIIIDFGNARHPNFIDNKIVKKNYLKNYKNIDIYNLVENITFYNLDISKNKIINNDKKWWFDKNKIMNDVLFMLDNVNNVSTILKYFLQKIKTA
jgi:serine/threonine protein kinase